MSAAPAGARASDDVRRSVLLTLTEHRGCYETFLARLFGPTTLDALLDLEEEGRARVAGRLWFLVRGVPRDPDAPIRNRILGRLSRANFYGDGWLSALQLASDLSEPSTVVGPVLRYLREGSLVEATDNRRAMRWRITPKGLAWLQVPGSALPTPALERAVPDVVAYVRLHGPCPRQQVVDATPHLSKRRAVDACRLAQARQLLTLLPGKPPLLVCPTTHARATSQSSPRSAAREPRKGSGRPTADAAASRSPVWGDLELPFRDAAPSSGVAE